MVHYVNENSPLIGLSIKDFMLAKAEIIVFINAFDENYSSRVVSRTSYISNVSQNCVGHPIAVATGAGSTAKENVGETNKRKTNKLESMDLDKVMYI